MRGPMRVIDGSSGLMECRVCGNCHYGNLQPGYLRADGITRLFRGSYQCSWEACPSNQKDWVESGSPILDSKGGAVALVSMGSETTSDGVRTPMQQWNGPQPVLKLALPPWLLRATKGSSRNVATLVAVRG
jgi:hypothetical protein